MARSRGVQGDGEPSLPKWCHYRELRACRGGKAEWSLGETIRLRYKQELIAMIENAGFEAVERDKVYYRVEKVAA